jgi:hypothetical protein
MMRPREEPQRMLTATIEETPIEVLNIIEIELGEMIGDGCAHMFIQALYDEIVIEGTNLTDGQVTKIYSELRLELKGLLGLLGLQTLDRKINISIKTKLGLKSYF